MAIPKKTVASVLVRDRGLCVLRLRDCLGDATVADHRANRGHGGARSGVLDQTSNLVAACGLCNGFKESGADQAELIGRGVRVLSGRTHQHTAEKARSTPVRYPDGLFYLDDSGGRSKIDETPY